MEVRVNLSPEPGDGNATSGVFGNLSIPVNLPKSIPLSEELQKLKPDVLAFLHAAQGRVQGEQADLVLLVREISAFELMPILERMIEARKAHVPKSPEGAIVISLPRSRDGLPSQWGVAEEVLLQLFHHRSLWTQHGDFSLAFCLLALVGDRNKECQALLGRIVRAAVTSHLRRHQGESEPTALPSSIQSRYERNCWAECGDSDQGLLAYTQFFATSSYAKSFLTDVDSESLRTGARAPFQSDLPCKFFDAICEYVEAARAGTELKRLGEIIQKQAQVFGPHFHVMVHHIPVVLGIAQAISSVKQRGFAEVVEISLAALHHVVSPFLGDKSRYRGEAGRERCKSDRYKIEELLGLTPCRVAEALAALPNVSREEFLAHTPALALASISAVSNDQEFGDRFNALKGLAITGQQVAILIAGSFGHLLRYLDDNAAMADRQPQRTKFLPEICHLLSKMTFYGADYIDALSAGVRELEMFREAVTDPGCTCSWCALSRSIAQPDVDVSLKITDNFISLCGPLVAPTILAGFAAIRRGRSLAGTRSDLSGLVGDLSWSNQTLWKSWRDLLQNKRAEIFERCRGGTNVSFKDPRDWELLYSAFGIPRRLDFLSTVPDLERLYALQYSGLLGNEDHLRKFVNDNRGVLFADASHAAWFTDLTRQLNLSSVTTAKKVGTPSLEFFLPSFSHYYLATPDESGNGTTMRWLNGRERVLALLNYRDDQVFNQFLLFHYVRGILAECQTRTPYRDSAVEQRCRALLASTRGLSVLRPWKREIGLMLGDEELKREREQQQKVQQEAQALYARSAGAIFDSSAETLDEHLVKLGRTLQDRLEKSFPSQEQCAQNAANQARFEKLKELHAQVGASQTAFQLLLICAEHPELTKRAETRELVQRVFLALAPREALPNLSVRRTDSLPDLITGLARIETTLRTVAGFALRQYESITGKAAGKPEQKLIETILNNTFHFERIVSFLGAVRPQILTEKTEVHTFGSEGFETNILGFLCDTCLVRKDPYEPPPSNLLTFPFVIPNAPLHRPIYSGGTAVIAVTGKGPLRNCLLLRAFNPSHLLSREADCATLFEQFADYLAEHGGSADFDAVLIPPDLTVGYALSNTVDVVHHVVETYYGQDQGPLVDLVELEDPGEAEFNGYQILGPCLAVRVMRRR